jgi:hypothetical protein
MYDLALNVANPFPFVLVDANNAEVLGLGGTFTVLVSKNGGAFGASAGAKAELSGGWYRYTALAAECDTAGPLALRITGVGTIQQNLVYMVGIASGTQSKIYTVTIDGAPGAGVYCRMTTDLAGVSSVDAGNTNAAGTVTLHHDLAAGTTVYIWRSKDGVQFVDPDTEVI